MHSRTASAVLSCYGLKISLQKKLQKKFGKAVDKVWSI